MLTRDWEAAGTAAGRVVILGQTEVLDVFLSAPAMARFHVNTRRRTVVLTFHVEP